MPTIANLNCADLVTKRSPERVAVAEHRLTHWNLAPKNVRRLEAYVAAAKATPPKAKAVKASRPTGPGSRGGDPAKAARAIAADAAGPRGSSAWWTAYRASK